MDHVKSLLQSSSGQITRYTDHRRGKEHAKFRIHRDRREADWAGSLWAGSGQLIFPLNHSRRSQDLRHAGVSYATHTPFRDSQMASFFGLPTGPSAAPSGSNRMLVTHPHQSVTSS